LACPWGSSFCQVISTPAHKPWRTRGTVCPDSLGVSVCLILLEYITFGDIKLDAS
jgi:hypothetical protein